MFTPMTPEEKIEYINRQQAHFEVSSVIETVLQYADEKRINDYSEAHYRAEVKNHFDQRRNDVRAQHGLPQEPVTPLLPGPRLAFPLKA
jgi:hypothetical protein